MAASKFSLPALRLEQLEDRCLRAYAIMDLGTLGGTDSLAFAVNNHGEVAGFSYDAAGRERAFIYRNGAMFDLGTLGGSEAVAYALNDRGQVTGRAHLPGDGAEHAFVWDIASGMEDLGTLGGNDSAGTGINEAGVVTGQADTPTGHYHAYVWDPLSGLMEDLGTLGTGQVSAARGINEHNQIVGGSFTGQGTSHACLWTDGVLQDLGGFGGPVTRGYAVNDVGVVVGRSDLPDNSATHAFRWVNNSPMRDLGTLGGANSSARSINNQLEIVGDSQTAGGETHAFIWKNGLMTDLNQLLPSNSGWVLYTAYGINNKGQIVGWGSHNGSPSRAYLLNRIQPVSFLPSPFPAPKFASRAETTVGMGFGLLKQSWLPAGASEGIGAQGEVITIEAEPGAREVKKVLEQVGDGAFAVHARAEARVVQSAAPHFADAAEDFVLFVGEMTS
jgi:probable HAF family extracellular repeat protein